MFGVVLAFVVLWILQDSQLSEPPKSTADFVGMLDCMVCSLLSVFSGVVEHQTQLVRFLWLGKCLQTKLFRDRKRIMQTKLVRVQ